jgi:hypothetical protein
MTTIHEAIAWAEDEMWKDLTPQQRKEAQEACDRMETDRLLNEAVRVATDVQLAHRRFDKAASHLSPDEFRQGYEALSRIDQEMVELVRLMFGPQA